MENKERLRSEGEKGLVKPITPESEIPREVAGWIERVEKKELYLSKPVTDDQGQVLVTSPGLQEPKIVLPLTKSGLVAGLKKEIEEAARWLAEWCLRLIKMYPRRIWFKQPKEEKVS